MANEIRLRVNNEAGSITDNPLTIGATTINSANFANLPVVDGTNHLMLILDPLEANGPAEIVKVTAHASAATVVTVVRAQEGSTARSHIVNTTWFHGPTRTDYMEDVSSDPVSDNYEGRMWYRTDQDMIKVHNGSTAVEALPLGTWQTWTPNVLQPGAVGSTTTAARFTRLGRFVIATFRISITGAGVAGNAVLVSLPVTGITGLGGVPRGHGWLFDSSTTTMYAGTWTETNGTHSALTTDATGGNSWGSTPSIALAAGDIIAAMFTYEAVAS